MAICTLRGFALAHAIELLVGIFLGVLGRLLFPEFGPFLSKSFAVDLALVPARVGLLVRLGLRLGELLVSTRRDLLAPSGRVGGRRLLLLLLPTFVGGLLVVRLV